MNNETIKNLIEGDFNNIRRIENPVRCHEGSGEAIEDESYFRLNVEFKDGSHEHIFVREEEL